VARNGRTASDICVRVKVNLDGIGAEQKGYASHGERRTANTGTPLYRCHCRGELSSVLALYRLFFPRLPRSDPSSHTDFGPKSEMGQRGAGRSPTD